MLLLVGTGNLQNKRYLDNMLPLFHWEPNPHPGTQVSSNLYNSSSSVLIELDTTSSRA